MIIVAMFLILATSCQKESVDLQVKQPKDLATNPVANGYEDGYHELIGPADASYNCFGLAFRLCETEEAPYIIPDGLTVYNNYIANGMFIEVSGSDSRASKVLYWNNSVDFGSKDPRAIDHAAMIASGGLVISKEGFTALYKNNINYYYLFPEGSRSTSWYRAYALNTALSCTNRTPKYGDIFTVSVPAMLEGAVYTWEFPTNLLQRVVEGDNLNSNVATFKVISNDYSATSIKLTVRHQLIPIVGTLYSRTLTSSVGVVIGTKPVIPPQVSGYVTGNSTINVGKTGLYRVVIKAGLAPYQIDWFLRKGNDGTGGILVATEETLTLQSVNAAIASYSKQKQGPMLQPIYSTDFYLSARIHDANNTMCITSEFHIVAYGNVNLIAITRE